MGQAYPIGHGWPDRHRTRLLRVDNRTDLAVGLWYAQIRQLHGAAEPGHIVDTGLFIASTGIAPFGVGASDPCTLRGGSRCACRGDEITGTLRVIDGFGDETDVALERASSAPGHYLPEVRWTLAYRDRADGARELWAGLDGVEVAG